MIVLDTHVWLWWTAAPDRLSSAATKAIDTASELAIPAISCFEVTRLALRGRIRLRRAPEAWIGQALAHPRVRSIELTPSIAIAGASLDHALFPGDPVDRVIYATARHHAAPLISADRAIRAFDEARVIW